MKYINVKKAIHARFINVIKLLFVFLHEEIICIKVISETGIQVMEKLVDIVLFLNREITNVFINTGIAPMSRSCILFMG